MNEVQRILSLFLMAGMLMHCHPAGKASFTDDELRWLIYDIDDTLHFYSNHNEQIKLQVGFKTELSRINTHYPIEAEVSVIDSTGYEWFKIYLLKDKKLFKKYLRYNNVYRSFDVAKTVRSFACGNRIYPMVYVFEEDTTLNTFDKAHPWRYFFAPENGIIRFDKLNNEIWLYEKCLEPDQ